MDKIELNFSELKNINECITTHTRISTILGQLINQKNEILSNTGTSSIDRIIGDFSINEDVITLKGEMLALLGYEYFWRQLILLQKRRKETGKKGLVAKITHSNSIQIWDNEWSSTAIDLQVKFIEAGGKVFRVLVDYISSNNDLNKYVEVVSKMNDKKIKVVYLPLSDTSPRDNPRFDFLLVESDDAIYSVKWNSLSNRTGIDHSITTVYKKSEDTSIEEKQELSKIIDALKNHPPYREGTPDVLRDIPDEILEGLSS